MIFIFSITFSGIEIKYYYFSYLLLIWVSDFWFFLNIHHTINGRGHGPTSSLTTSLRHYYVGISILIAIVYSNTSHNNCQKNSVRIVPIYMSPPHPVKEPKTLLIQARARTYIRMVYRLVIHAYLRLTICPSFKKSEKIWLAGHRTEMKTYSIGLFSRISSSPAAWTHSGWRT